MNRYIVFSALHLARWEARTLEQMAQATAAARELDHRQVHESAHEHGPILATQRQETLQEMEH